MNNKINNCNKQVSFRVFLDQLEIAQRKPLIINCAIFIYNKLTNLRISIYNKSAKAPAKTQTACRMF